MQQDRLQYPPPGEMVDIGDISLHIYCIGEGSPTVIFESGLGQSSLYWTHIQEEISRETRACAYDRAGTGWSDISQELPVDDYVATNLNLLLSAYGIVDPLLLVGHSSGGLYARQYAEQYPDAVAGMVLLDSTHENQLADTAPEQIPSNPDPILSLCTVVARFGILRAIGLGETMLANEPLEDDSMQALIASVNRSGYCGGLIREQQASLIDANQETPPESLGDIPLIVLVHDFNQDADNLAADNQEPQRSWLDMQEELAGLSSNSRLQIVEDSGHMIQFDRPDVVIDAILDIFNQINN